MPGDHGRCREDWTGAVTQSAALEHQARRVRRFAILVAPAIICLTASGCGAGSRPESANAPSAKHVRALSPAWTLVNRSPEAIESHWTSKRMRRAKVYKAQTEALQAIAAPTRTR